MDHSEEINYQIFNSLNTFLKIDLPQSWGFVNGFHLSFLSSISHFIKERQNISPSDKKSLIPVIKRWITSKSSLCVSFLKFTYIGLIKYVVIFIIFKKHNPEELLNFTVLENLVYSITTKFCRVSVTKILVQGKSIKNVLL